MSPLQVQVVRQLLAVEGNIELLPPFPEGDGVQIRHDPSADGLGSRMKAPSGERQILVG